MVRNISIDMFNAKIEHPIEQLDEDEIDNTVISLENSFLNKISQNELLEFVDNLPTLQRNVLILHSLLGLNIDETAQRLNISLAAASKRFTLARKAIKKFVEERSKNDE